MFTIDTQSFWLGFDKEYSKYEIDKYNDLDIQIYRGRILLKYC